MADPAAYYEDWLARMQNRGTGRQPPRFPALAPEEEESAFSTLGRKTLAGVGWLGQTLDKALGARALRGLLGGKPEELASLIPFSDTLGITDPHNAVYGRDLLEKAGVLSPNQEGLDWGDVAGLGADVLLDPATYLTFGASALGRAGKLAKLADVLPSRLRPRLAGSLAQVAPAGSQAASDVARAARASGTALTPELLAEPLGGIARLRVPLTEAGVNLGSPATYDALAGLWANYPRRGLNWLGERTGAGEPLRAAGRSFKALFNPRYMNLTSRTGQEAASQAYDLGKAAEVQARYDVGGVMQRLGRAGALTDEEFLRTNQTLRDMLEGLQSPINPVSARYGQLPLAQQAIGQEATELRRLLDQSAARESDLGILSRVLEDYAPRGMSPNLKQTLGKGYSRVAALDPFDPSSISRQHEVFGDLPTSWINPALRSDLAELNPLQRAEFMRREVLHPWEAMRESLGKQTPVAPLPPDAQPYRYLENRRVTLGREFAAPRRVTRGVAFGRLNDTETARMTDLATRSRAGTALTPVEARELAGLSRRWDQALEFDRLQDVYNQSLRLSDYAASVGPQLNAAGVDLFGPNLLADVQTRLTRGGWREAKAGALYDTLARESGQLGTLGVPETPLADVMRNLEQRFALTDRATPALMRRMGMDPNLPADLARFSRVAVPEQVAADVVRAATPFRAPEAFQPVLDLWDAATNLTKAYQVGIWPARYTRDVLQQAWAGANIGARPAVREALTAFREGRPFEGILDLPQFQGSGLSPQQAADELSRLAYAHGVAGRAGRLTRDADLVGGQGLEWGGRFPGEARPGIGSILNRMYNPTAWESRIPWDVAGVGGRTRTGFTPLRAGHELSAYIDDATRGGAWLDLLRQGYTPTAAAREVSEAMYDFSRLSDFERSVMRRLVPYFSWSRRNIPYMAEQLTARPGALNAQAVKAVGRGQAEAGFRPEYISETLGLPVGESEVPERDRFLTALGLPFEDFRDVGNLERLLGQTNPLLKAPLELATGRQFYTGRDLADLYGPTGIPDLDQLVMNSPLSRFYTTGRTLIDPAKGMLTKAANVLGPGKVSDVNMEKARDRAAQQAITEALRGQPGVRVMQRPYVPAGQEVLLNPEEVLLMRLQASLEKRARERAAKK